MPRRIVLVRHGPSSHVHNEGKVDRAGVERWRDAYDLAGIKTECVPPAALLHLASEATHVVSSDLPRAVRSAEKLALREVPTSALLRETRLLIPNWPTRLPLTAWAALIHLHWTYRILRRTDESFSDRTRARAAIEWLEGLATNDATVLAVTHGVFRIVVAKHLLASGWTNEARRGGYDHWSSWSFIRPDDRPSPYSASV